MPRQFATVLVALVTSCAVVGGWNALRPASNGGVAVVDLDEIAKRLGRTDQMQQSVSSQTDQLNQQLTALQQDAANKFDKLKSEVGVGLTEEKSATLQKVSQAINVKLNTAKQVAEMKLGQHRQMLAQEFRTEAKPYAEKVAKSRGFGTVVTKNDTMVFTFADTVDITNEVFLAMQASGHAAAPAAPRADQQPQPPQQPASPIQQAGFEQPGAN